MRGAMPLRMIGQELTHLHIFEKIILFQLNTYDQTWVYDWRCLLCLANIECSVMVKIQEIKYFALSWKRKINFKCDFRNID